MTGRCSPHIKNGHHFCHTTDDQQMTEKPPATDFIITSAALGNPELLQCVLLHYMASVQSPPKWKKQTFKTLQAWVSGCPNT